MTNPVIAKEIERFPDGTALVTIRQYFIEGGQVVHNRTHVLACYETASRGATKSARREISRLKNAGVISGAEKIL